MAMIRYVETRRIENIFFTHIKVIRNRFYLVDGPQQHSFGTGFYFTENKAVFISKIIVYDDAIYFQTKNNFPLQNLLQISRK